MWSFRYLLNKWKEGGEERRKQMTFLMEAEEFLKVV